MKLFTGKSGYKAVVMNRFTASFIFRGTLFIDDFDDKYIKDDEIIYIPVLNYMCRKDTFVEWDNKAKYYLEDLYIENEKIKDLELLVNLNQVEYQTIFNK